MEHKCRVYYNSYSGTPWITQCINNKCYTYRAYISSYTWEEAMLEALHHKMRNESFK